MRPRLLLISLALAAAAAVVVAGVLLLSDDNGRSGTATDRVLGGKQQQGKPASVSLAWVGDISVSTSYGLPPQPGSLFAGVTRPLSAPDVTVGNLEGTLGAGGGSKCAAAKENCFAFQAPPAYARLLRRAGFDVLNLANNHAFDYGASGQAQTIAALERRRLRHTGRPGELVERRVGGLDLAFLGFAPYPWANELRDIPGARRLVSRAARRADVVVVIIHAGAEGSDQTHTPTGTEVAFGEDRGNTRAFAHAAVRAGADLVLGSGPHVVRGIERYRGRLIAYSLGNFLGFHTFSTGGGPSPSGSPRVGGSQEGVPVGGGLGSGRR